MFHCFTFFLVIRFYILRLSLNAPALHQLFYGVSPQGGEKNKELEGVWLPMGSPPRRRGKVHLHPDAAKQRGITPAWAGKRQPTPASTTASQDHPRVGGEKVGMMKVWWEV